MREEFRGAVRSGCGVIGSSHTRALTDTLDGLTLPLGYLLDPSAKGRL